MPLRHPSTAATDSWSPLHLIAVVLPVLVFATVYIPAVGQGFISDDFGWIAQSKMEKAGDLRNLLPRQHAFYRPVVSLSFAANYTLFGNRARGYGLTNFALALACMALVAVLIRSLGLPIGAAMFGASVWLLNFHGINMAVLWISGRTALLVTLAALATAIAVVRGRYIPATVFLMAALLSKEEAVTLPFVLAVWIYLQRDRRWRALAAWSALSAAALAAYFALRATFGAMSPSTAP